MKKTLVAAVLAISVLTCVHAQNEAVYYYYKGQKSYVPVTYQRVVVCVKNQLSFTGAKSSIVSLLSVKQDSVKKTSTLNQLVIHLGGKADQIAKNAVSLLRTKAFIEYVHPCLIGVSGKYAS